MKMPSITIAFKEKGITAIQRSMRGIVAMILKEDDENLLAGSPHTIYSTTDVPEGLSDFNKDQIELCLKGYQTTPKKIFVFVHPADASNYNETLLKLENTMRWDYLTIPEITETEAEIIATWVKSMRTVKNKKIKAVLPNTNADNEGVVNFTNEFVTTKASTYTTPQFCSRIAGIITGTPMTISCTYAPLPEVLDADKYEAEQMDEKVNKGELFIFNDGEKYKISRGVNSFVTLIQDKLQSFQKIKIVDAMDMIHDDIKKTSQDYYIGKYSNSYDNKCLLISAIKGYFLQLELDGILNKHYDNQIFIDVPTQKAWLLANGLYTQDELEEMSEQQIKEADTKDQVFLGADIKILDAIEDIKLNIQI